MPAAANEDSSQVANALSNPKAIETNEESLARSFIGVIDKKIRNLCKRKTKLENLKKIEEEGKELNQDQKEAISQAKSVETDLETYREINQQYYKLMEEWQKNQKKQMRKEQATRIEADRVRICDILKLQRLLAAVNPETRQYFLEGSNGATKLNEDEIRQIEAFQELVLDPTSVKTSGDHFYNLIEKKEKPVVGTTYDKLMAVMQGIELCSLYTGELKDKVTEPVKEEPQQETVERPSNGDAEVTSGELLPAEVKNNDKNVEVAVSAEKDSVSEEKLNMPNAPTGDFAEQGEATEKDDGFESQKGNRRPRNFRGGNRGRGNQGRNRIRNRNGDRGGKEGAGGRFPGNQDGQYRGGRGGNRGGNRGGRPRGSGGGNYQRYRDDRSSQQPQPQQQQQQ
ncbi:uncharacterized protein TRIADDRAFT_62347 [Trichoplax adhaerens]|uniref:Caprin-1 dimerization domain-containing protein n=1 Tax=Trichoplax adhaerens TaxID=10228 RepID=B3SDI8_TRIAD|nr:hypothetical protein TRIADDRAFT_62347 [Trichoplax adhaerens]EDV19198.1 hypothetical protein TRIADDRAFT_62347 [Trichoplax adhaerens]|eukprot:XP_002118318.1 hypothetical protein TRIADDRAFT_62347 [Trichoplax adhaerens]